MSSAADQLQQMSDPVTVTQRSAIVSGVVFVETAVELTPSWWWLGPAISAVAATAAALLSLIQINRSRLSHDATLFLNISSRYNSPEMAKALRELAAYQHKYPEDFSERWKAAYDAGDEEAKQLNEFRRLVTRFFTDIGRLYEFRIIGKATARALSAFNGIAVFYEVCEPMNYVHDPKRDNTYALALKRVRKTYGRGAVA